MVWLYVFYYLSIQTHTYIWQILMAWYGTNHERPWQLKKPGSEKLVSVPPSPALEMCKCQFFPHDQEGLVSGFSIIPNWSVHFYAAHSIFLLKYSLFVMFCVLYTAKWFSYIFFLYPYRLLQNVKYSSLCYTLGPSWWPILYTTVCIG